MTKAGYVKAVPASQFRTQGRGGRGVQGRPAQGGGPGHPDHPHQRPRLPAVLLQPGQGLPAAGLRGAGQGAHRPRDRHRQPAAARARTSGSRPSSTPASSQPTAICCSPPGPGRSRRPRSPSTTSPAGRASSPSTCATATSWSGSSPPSGDDDIFMVSRMGMAIRFAETDVRPMGRDAAGVRGMQLRPRRRGGLDRSGPGRHEHPDRDRRRLREAHPAAPFPPPGPGRPRGPGHQADRAARPGGFGFHGGTGRRDPGHLLGGGDGANGRSRDLQPGPRRHRRAGRSPSIPARCVASVAPVLAVEESG